MNYKRPWKKNLRKIPPQILEKIAAFASDECVVSCAAKIDVENIQSGLFSHLGIRWVKEMLELEERVVPPPDIGIFSRRNQNGYEVVYKDQPKTKKSWSVETPNYGDWDKGSHDIVFTKEVYRRDYVGRC